MLTWLSTAKKVISNVNFKIKLVNLKEGKNCSTAGQCNFGKLSKLSSETLFYESNLR